MASRARWGLRLSCPELKLLCSSMSSTSLLETAPAAVSVPSHCAEFTIGALTDVFAVLSLSLTYHFPRWHLIKRSRVLGWALWWIPCSASACYVESPWSRIPSCFCSSKRAWAPPAVRPLARPPFHLGPRGPGAYFMSPGQSPFSGAGWAPDCFIMFCALWFISPTSLNLLTFWDFYFFPQKFPFFVFIKLLFFRHLDSGSSKGWFCYWLPRCCFHLFQSSFLKHHKTILHFAKQ